MSTHDLLELIVGQWWQVTILCVVARWLSTTVLKNDPVLSYQLWILVMFKSITPPLWASHCGVFSWFFQGLTAGSLAAVRFLFGPSATNDLVAMWVVTAWAVGTLLYLTHAVWQWHRIERRIVAQAVETPPALQKSLMSLIHQLGIRQPIRLVVTSEPIGPAVIGFRKPTIILPKHLVAGSRVEQITPILAHELLHVRRGDTLVALLETMVRAIWWFHPSVQRAADLMSNSGELCCDQDVLDRLGLPPRAYAESLLAVIEAKVQLRPLAGQPGIRQGQVTGDRLRRIMTRGHGQPPRVMRLGLLWLGVLVVLPGRSFF